VSGPRAAFLGSVERAVTWALNLQQKKKATRFSVAVSVVNDFPHSGDSFAQENSWLLWSSYISCRKAVYLEVVAIYFKLCLHPSKSILSKKATVHM
jgi:hypothetical protein